MKNNQSQSNTVEIMTYSVLGAFIIGYLEPTYIPYMIIGGVLVSSLLGILKLLTNTNDYDTDFIEVEKDKIKYFKK